MVLPPLQVLTDPAKKQRYDMGEDPHDPNHYDGHGQHFQQWHTFHHGW
jgi:hypothetical protein